MEKSPQSVEAGEQELASILLPNKKGRFAQRIPGVHQVVQEIVAKSLCDYKEELSPTMRSNIETLSSAGISLRPYIEHVMKICSTAAELSDLVRSGSNYSYWIENAAVFLRSDPRIISYLVEKKILTPKEMDRIIRYHTGYVIRPLHEGKSLEWWQSESVRDFFTNGPRTKEPGDEFLALQGVPTAHQYARNEHNYTPPSTPAPHPLFDHVNGMYNPTRFTQDIERAMTELGIMYDDARWFEQYTQIADHVAAQSPTRKKFDTDAWSKLSAEEREERRQENIAAVRRHYKEAEQGAVPKGTYRFVLYVRKSSNRGFRGECNPVVESICARVAHEYFSSGKSLLGNELVVVANKGVQDETNPGYPGLALAMAPSATFSIAFADEQKHGTMVYFTHSAVREARHIPIITWDTQLSYSRRPEKFVAMNIIAGPFDAEHPLGNSDGQRLEILAKQSGFTFKDSADPKYDYYDEYGRIKLEEKGMSSQEVSLVGIAEEMYKALRAVEEMEIARAGSEDKV